MSELTNPLLSLNIIADALELTLKREIERDVVSYDLYHSSDELYKICDSLDAVALALRVFIISKEKLDVNRGIYLAKERGATSYN